MHGVLVESYSTSHRCKGRDVMAIEVIELVDYVPPEEGKTEAQKEAELRMAQERLGM